MSQRVVFCTNPCTDTTHRPGIRRTGDTPIVITYVYRLYSPVGAVRVQRPTSSGRTGLTCAACSSGACSTEHSLRAPPLTVPNVFGIEKRRVEFKYNSETGVIFLQ